MKYLIESIVTCLLLSLWALTILFGVHACSAKKPDARVTYVVSFQMPFETDTTGKATLKCQVEASGLLASTKVEAYQVRESSRTLLCEFYIEHDGSHDIEQGLMAWPTTLEFDENERRIIRVEFDVDAPDAEVWIGNVAIVAR